MFLHGVGAFLIFLIPLEAILLLFYKYRRNKRTYL
jgi:hypothetical protein